MQGKVIWCIHGGKGGGYTRGFTPGGGYTWGLHCELLLFTIM